MTLTLARDRPGASGALGSMLRPARDDRVRMVVATHYNAVRRAMRRLGVAESDLDDILQEIFLVFVRRLPEIPPHAERGFLLQVGFHIVRRWQRAYVRRREEFDETFDHGALPAPPTPEDAMSQRERVELLDRLLSEMPADLRAVLVLCDIEEATLDEAATILDVKVGTVSSRLFRAREVFDKLALRARAAQTGRSR